MKSLNPCHSEASNISAMSTKEEEEEEEESGTKHETTMSRVVLDLKLTNNDSMNKRNPSSKLLEFNLPNSPNEGKSKSSKSKIFTCSFCGREFPTSQALGGHQNAHKQERALAKNRHIMGDVTAAAASAPPPYSHPQGYSYYPYSTFHHHAPNSFGDLNRSHGVRAGPMIHKPYSYHQPSSSSSSSFAHSLACEKMTRAYLMSPSSSSRPDDGLKGENLQPRGLGMDKFCASLNLGVNPNPTTIVFFDSATTKADDEGGDDEKHQRLTLGNIVDDGNDASGVLDLDLKL